MVTTVPVNEKKIKTTLLKEKQMKEDKKKGVLPIHLGRKVW